MELIHARCAGLDVHKDSVVACVRIQQDDRVRHEVRTFGTTTSALMDLAGWLRDNGSAQAVLESTGIYWKPVWHVLVGAGLKLVLANAEHVGRNDSSRSCANSASWSLTMQPSARFSA
jgi:transposase